MSSRTRGNGLSVVDRLRFRSRLIVLALATGFALIAFSPAPAGAVGTGTISGTVTDGMDNPLDGICVEAYDSDGTGSSPDFGVTDFTDSNGEYTLVGLETGEYRVSFMQCDENTNVLDEFYDDEQTFAEATPISVTDGSDTAGIDAQLAKGGSISGNVTNGSNGPHGDTCVLAYDSTGDWTRHGRTDSDGDYTVGGLETGEYRLKFQRCETDENVAGEFYPDKGTVGEASLISVTAGSDTPDINAHLTEGGSISGMVSGSGAPFVPAFCNLRVSAYDTDGAVVGSFESNSYQYSSDYTIDKLRTGNYKVGFGISCWTPPDLSYSYTYSEFYDDKATLAEATPIAVTEGETTTNVNALLPEDGSISGTVTDEMGNPLDGICVEAFDPDGDLANVAHTTTSGSYEVNQLLTSNYRLKFSDCLNPNDSPVTPEFYDNEETLADAAPVFVTMGIGTSSIDAQLAVKGTAAPDTSVKPGPSGTTVPKATISKVSVKGPSKVKKGKKATYRVKITNSGNAKTTGVRLRVKGGGVRLDTSVGTISAGTTKTVKVKLKPKKPGKAKLTFRVTSSNAGGKSVKQGITVKK